MKLAITLKTTRVVSTQILIFGNSFLRTRLNATGKPSPGIVTLPQRTSSAIPVPKMVQPKICAMTFCQIAVGKIQDVIAILTSSK